MPVVIAGAGLAGLLAAHAWPQAPLFEAMQEPRAHHRALLRFRSDAVARLIGIEFKQVTVRKGIWMHGQFIVPSIQAANMYSRKILSALEPDRSIWNIEPVQRFIAPEHLYEQMIETVGPRVRWNSPFDFDSIERTDSLISTVPMPVVLKMINMNENEITFRRAPIKVQRFRVPKAAVYQTIYFPELGFPAYRASITGDLLIVECVSKAEADDISVVLKAFAIDDALPMDEIDQQYGKISPLPDIMRKAVLLKLTAKRNIFSLGRFATWRNILLDDVVDDIAVIRKLLRASEYEQRLHFSKGDDVRTS